MPVRNAAFEAYLREAAGGRNGLLRLVAGVTLIIVSFAIPIACTALIAFALNLSPAYFSEGRSGIAAMLLSIIWLIPATALAVRVMHRRRPASILGIDGSISPRQFGRAFMTTAIVMVAAMLVSLAFDPRINRGPASLGMWAAVAPLFTFLILMQTAAEEIFYRGYLVQTLASRYRSSFIWFGIPAVLFTASHWNGELGMAMNLGMLATIASFAIAATVLLVLTGNLGAAMGFHFANNVVAVLFFSSSIKFNPVALFVLPPVESPEWSSADAALFAAIQIAAIVIVLILLIHARSPFRIVNDGAKSAPPGVPNPVPIVSDR